MSKAEERACQYTGYCRNQSYSDFLNGYHQAEKDLELTWKDIKLVYNITYDESRNVSLNKGGEISEQEFYKEVLKRFNKDKIYGQTCKERREKAL